MAQVKSACGIDDRFRVEELCRGCNHVVAANDLPAGSRLGNEALIGFITCRGTKIPHRPTVNQGALPRAVHRS